MLRHLHFYAGYFIRRSMRQKLAAYLGSTGRCAEVQRATLQRIMQLNHDSDYSRRRGLTEHLDVEQFRNRIEISNFETVRPEIERLKAGEQTSLLGTRNKLLMFALSSGTTSDSKFIPITTQFLKDYRQGWNLWGISAFDAHPRLCFTDIVQLSSNFDVFRTENGIPCGNISGLVNKMQHPAVRLMYTVPYQVTQIENAEAKLYTALRMSVENANVGLVMTANPSTLVQLAKLADRERHELIRDIADGTLSPRMNVSEKSRAALKRRITRRNRTRARQLEQIVQRTGHLHPRDFWPQLTLAAVWTGGSASAYLDTLRKFYGDVPIRDHGLSASEGRMTIPFADKSSQGVLDIHSHFFEFIPEEEYNSPQRTVLQAHELEVGRNYYILLTTPSGLYRYDICDVVRCGGFHGTTPCVEFLHKGASTSSITGEKLTESQVVSAVKQGVRSVGLDIDMFTLSPVWGDPPRYRLHVEESAVLQKRQLSLLVSTIDDELKNTNCEYYDKRHSGRLAPLECCLLPQGTWQQFATFRQSRRGGSLEQYKHPCLVPSLEFSETLSRDFAEAARKKRVA